MAYKLKYYKVLPGVKLSSGGKSNLTLNIYEKDYTGTSKQIDALTSLILEADCQDAQSPIQKVILRIGLADRPEMPDTDTRKYGGWEEFFTPDATRYLVEMLVAGSAIWKGYITPDAWSETLDFHASVSVTARDNIGHLEDFEFASDSELISVDEIISSAMALIEPQFTIIYDYANDYTIESEDGISITDAYVNTSLFTGKSWYEVLESVLTSLGMCIRYVGWNQYFIGFLRYVSQYNGGTTVQNYLRGSATLTLAPAYREIIEDDAYDFEEFGMPDFQNRVLDNSSSEDVTYKYEGLSSVQSATTTITYAGIFSNRIGWSEGSFHCLNDDVVNGGIKFDRTKAALIPLTKRASFNFGKVNNVPLKIDFSAIYIFSMLGSKTLKSSNVMQIAFSYVISRRYVNDAGEEVTRYFYGSAWQNTLKYTDISISAGSFGQKIESTKNISVNLPVDSQTSKGGNIILTVYFKDAVASFVNNVNSASGVYMAVDNLQISDSLSYVKLESNKVTTLNDGKYNVRKTFRPEIAAMSSTDVTVVNHTNYKNIFWLNAYTPFPYNVRWRKDGDAECKPLPALLAMQMLCYGLRPMARIDGQRMSAADGFYKPYSRGSQRLTPLDYRYDYLSGQLNEIAFESVQYEDAFLQYDVILTSIGDLNKTNAITYVSNIAGVSLPVAKTYVESILAGTPTVVATVTYLSKAQQMLQSFIDLGFSGQLSNH